MGEEFLVQTSYPGYVFVGWAAGSSCLHLSAQLSGGTLLPESVCGVGRRKCGNCQACNG